MTLEQDTESAIAMYLLAVAFLISAEFARRRQRTASDAGTLLWRYAALVLSAVCALQGTLGLLA
jgi:hypothetical protein